MDTKHPAFKLLVDMSEIFEKKINEKIEAFDNKEVTADANNLLNSMLLLKEQMGISELINEHKVNQKQNIGEEFNKEFFGKNQEIDTKVDMSEFDKLARGDNVSYRLK